MKRVGTTKNVENVKRRVGVIFEDMKTEVKERRASEESSKVSPKGRRVVVGRTTT